jgi:hypothetical protein
VLNNAGAVHGEGVVEVAQQLSFPQTMAQIIGSVVSTRKIEVGKIGFEYKFGGLDFDFDMPQLRPVLPRPSNEVLATQACVPFQFDRAVAVAAMIIPSR